jgi:SAM-dependent methyltransferase
MNEAQVNHFWQNHPCGDDQVGGLKRYKQDYERFFADYDAFRYKKERHILDCLDKISFQGKQVLEIGLGQGAESEQIIRRGGVWSGLELTAESTRRVAMRLKVKKLQYKALKQGSTLDIPYDDNQFDIVFSHGVLHHIPEIVKAQREIWRVLRPGGELIAMVYAKWSLNYLLSIGVIRRLMLLYQHIFNIQLTGKPGVHLEAAREMGLFSYLKMENYIHRNTDGPHNPYSKVYDRRIIQHDFPDFDLIKSYRRFMHAPPLHVGGLPFEKFLGWHLWVHLYPKNK